MINLVIDRGNTFTKVAVFNQNKIIFSVQSPVLELQEIQKLKEKYQFQNLIISSVKDDVDLEEFKKQFNPLIFSHLVAIPIQNNYKSPQTLGLDRLAAVIGAQHIFHKQRILVIDAGTCITYDVLHEKGEYDGGSISPGIKMRLDAMHHFTAKLPLVSFDANFENEFGKDTKEAMLSGVVNGVVFEIEGFIKQQIQKYPSTKIILCGGDASFFDYRFKNSIFAHLILHEPNLVLIGLNTVVNYQHDHK